jgi:hypothetical protein
MRTSAGADFQAAVMSSTSSNGTGTYAPANYIALSTNATAPASGDTTLAGELNNASGGLNRAQATYAHTAGTSSYTLTKTFTANSNDGASNTIQKIGVFNAASVGTLVFETAVPSPPTLVSGDQITITETVSI